MVNWVKLDRQRLVNKSIMMYKIVNNMVPEYLCSHLNIRQLLSLNQFKSKLKSYDFDSGLI